MHRSLPPAAPDIFNEPPMQRLLAAETQALLPELGGLAGAHGLQVGAMQSLLEPPSTPMIGRWTRLRLDASGYQGDVRARRDESLPFLANSFRVVLLRHLPDELLAAPEMVEEFARVLVPEGLLVVTALSPLSAWTPWLAWRARHQRVPQSAWPVTWRRRWAGAGIETFAVRRFGGALPYHRAGTAQWRWLQGGYLLLARKRRLATTPLRLRAAPRTATVAGSWAPGARRNCA